MHTAHTYLWWHLKIFLKKQFSFMSLIPIFKKSFDWIGKALFLLGTIFISRKVFLASYKDGPLHSIIWSFHAVTITFMNLFIHSLLLVFTYGVKSSISGDSQWKHNDHKNGQHNDQIWHSPFLKNKSMIGLVLTATLGSRIDVG